MSDAVTSARTARERLAQGLGALQAPGVPEHLMSVAEPIARAMSSLHRIESSGGQAAHEAGPVALDAVRAALGMLQAQTVNHPSVDAALEAVAGSLGLVHNLVKITSVAPQAMAPQAMAPQPVAQALAMPMTAPAPAPAVPAVMAAPGPGPSAAFAATALVGAQPGYGYPAAVAPQPMAPQPMAPPAPAMVAAPVAINRGPVGGSYGGASDGAAPDSSFAPNSTMPSKGAERPPPGGAGGSPFVASETQPEAKPLAVAGPPLAAVPGQLRLEAALGAHSPTNFYKGLSGNDVVDSGGIFVGTYQIPRIGTPLLLKVSLPGGYEFEAQAVVRWTREPASASDGASPGFGAQFTAISPEGRQLVYRYVRNREPLFHDDL
jgi:hypothetical protein